MDLGAIVPQFYHQIGYRLVDHVAPSAQVKIHVGAWLGVAMNGTVVPLMLTQSAMALLTVAVALTLVQRHGIAPRPTAPA